MTNIASPEGFFLRCMDWIAWSGLWVLGMLIVIGIAGYWLSQLLAAHEGSRWQRLLDRWADWSNARKDARSVGTLYTR